MDEDKVVSEIVIENQIGKAFDDFKDQSSAVQEEHCVKFGIRFGAHAANRLRERLGLPLRPKLAIGGGLPEAPLPPPNTSDIDRLTYPRGLVGHVTQYVEDTAELPNRWLSMATALCACAKGLDRKVLGPRGNSVILWLLLLAETGAGKQHALNCLRILLRAMAIENVIVASGLGSIQGIEEILMGTTKFAPQPNALIIVDEVGAWLSRISTTRQVGNVAEIPATLQSLWGWPPQLEWVGQKTKDKDMTPVYGPAFSLFGASTEVKFIKALTGEQISNGFVNRMVLFNIGRGAEKRVKAKYDWLKFPEWLAKALKKVAGNPAPVGGIILNLLRKDGETVILQDFRRIGWGIGAEEHWQTYEDSIRAMPSAEDRELWIRAPENALRLATIVAAFSGTDVIEVADLTWAIAVIEHSMRQLTASLRKNMTQDLSQLDLVGKIRTEFLKKLRKSGSPSRLTQGVIRKLCENLTHDYRKIDQALDHMVKCGDIIEIDRCGKVGQPTRVWEWAEE